jgi:hypothetical protein
LHQAFQRREAFYNVQRIPSIQNVGALASQTDKAMRARQL